jgi:hypothetical protein
MTQPTNCDPAFTAGSVTLVLDAPRQSLATQSLPKNFRSMQKIPNISGTAASGSAEFSASQFQAMIDQTVVTLPMTIVDLRQESHGFVTIKEPLNGETEIAVGWFVERDWLNVAKGLPSILLNEHNSLSGAARLSNLDVYDVTSKTPTEDGICTATQYTVQPTGAYREEQTLVQAVPKVSYLRLPSTDHCRPRDHEVDQFVAFEASLPSDMWLHFHCRAGDGRTTTFMAMHDIIHNAPGDSLATILARQKSIGGVDLSSYSGNSIDFSAPFSDERVDFVANFYDYVVQAKPGNYKLTWSEWVMQQIPQQQLAVSA